MQRLLFIIYIIFSSFNSFASEVHFKTNDNARIFAEFQKRDSHAVLLAHAAIFNKESWGEFEKQLLENNYTILAIDFRGYGQSTKSDQPNALYQDILAGVKFLQAQSGINKITVLGASMGGAAAAKASVYSQPGSINQLILLSPAIVYQADKLKGDLLFIVSEDEYLAKALKYSYNKAPKPKMLKLIPGNAHAQHIFKTSQADALTLIILDFLKE
jgi:pimeloyl-ACP methyl ester carboxylesterase